MKKLFAFVPLNFIFLLLISGTGHAQTNTTSGTVNISGGTTTLSQTLTPTAGGTINLIVTSTGTLSVNASGTIAAITLNGTTSNVSISNDGLIQDTGNGAAVQDVGGHATLTINNGSTTDSAATIQTANNDALNFSKASNNLILNNYGLILSNNSSAGGNQAVDWNKINNGGGTAGGNNTINNFYSGTIKAIDADAVRPGVNGFVNNSGTIKSTIVTDLGGGDDGIDAQANTGITIVNGAASTTGAGATNLIEGARHGITGTQTSATTTFTMSITNNANSTIQGDNGSGINIDGFNALEVVTINNSGTITGDGTTVKAGNSSQDGDGVDVDGVVNIVNSGTIKSLNAINDTSEGITVGGGTITNTGTIEGSVATLGGTNVSAVGRGITLAGLDKNASGASIPIQTIYANTTVTNSGLIKGDTDSGIAILGISGPTGSTVLITNNVTGIIDGSGTVAVIDGSALANGEGTASANPETVVNYGKIIAEGTGNAISLGNGNNVVQILGSSATVVGGMSGGYTGTNTASLTIDPSSTGAFTYSGNISNFSSVIVASGSVTLSGTNTYTATTAVTGGKLSLNGSVTGSVAISNGAELGGHGVIGGAISGAGAVGPGNSPGILTAGSINTTTGMSFNFELTQAGTATWSNAAASGNDVLHLTAALPFTAPLTSSNTINLYFSSLNLTFDGGFFTNGSTDDLTSNISGATFNYYILDNANGAFTYNGNKYDLVTGSESTLQIANADFGTGTVNGFTEQFYVAIPEPSTWLLIGIGALGLVIAGYRRNRIG